MMPIDAIRAARSVTGRDNGIPLRPAPAPLRPAPAPLPPAAAPLQETPPRLLTVRQAASLLNISGKSVYELISREVFPTGVVCRLGRSIRIDRQALLAWCAAGGGR